MIVPRILAPAALGGIVLAVLLALIGHLDPAPHYNPLSLTISDYALADRTGALDAAMVTLGCATVLLLAAMWTARVPVRWPSTVLLLTGGAELAVAAWVPTDPLGTPMTTGGYVHRYVSVAAFISLPLAGQLLVRRFEARLGRRIRALSRSAGVGLLAMLYVAGPGNRVLIGLVERLLVGVEVTMLGVLALGLCRLSWVVRPVPAGRVPLCGPRPGRAVPRRPPGAPRLRHAAPAGGPGRRARWAAGPAELSPAPARRAG